MARDSDIETNGKDVSLGVSGALWKLGSVLCVELMRRGDAFVCTMKLLCFTNELLWFSTSTFKIKNIHFLAARIIPQK